MDKGYIAPDTALKNRRYRYVSCEEDTCALITLAGNAPEGRPKGIPKKCQKER